MRSDTMALSNPPARSLVTYAALLVFFRP